MSNHAADRRSTARLAALGAALCIPLSLATIAHGDERPADRLTAAVSLKDLDLGTPDGQRAAVQRVTARARQLCNLAANESDYIHRLAHFSGCVEQTVADARVSLDRLIAQHMRADGPILAGRTPR